MKDGETPSFGEVTAMIEEKKTSIWMESLQVMYVLCATASNVDTKPTIDKKW